MINKRAAKKRGSFLAALSHTRGGPDNLDNGLCGCYGEDRLNEVVHSQLSQGLSTNRRAIISMSKPDEVRSS